MQYLSIDQYSDKQDRAAQRVLDSLERMDVHQDEQYSNQRKHERKQFRSQVTVAVPTPGVDDPRDDPNNIFTAWGRSISQAGMSFIHPSKILEERVLIGLSLADDSTTWFQGEIVRKRQIPEEDFWEHGVAFKERLST